MRSDKEVERLVVENIAIVRIIARKHFRSICNDQDLLQCGNIGLWKAAQSWRGVAPFRAFASMCVRQAMLKYVERDTHKEYQPLGEAEEETAEYEDGIIDALDLHRRICEAWPENSRERYILIALSKGVSKLAIAAAIGKDVQTVKKIAVKALEGIKKEGG